MDDIQVFKIAEMHKDQPALYPLGIMARWIVEHKDIAKRLEKAEGKSYRKGFNDGVDALYKIFMDRISRNFSVDAIKYMIESGE